MKDHICLSVIMAICIALPIKGPSVLPAGADWTSSGVYAMYGTGKCNLPQWLCAIIGR